MDFCVLGPVRALDGDRPVPVPAGRPRTLLASLLLRPNRVVTVPELIGRLWADGGPVDPRAAVHTCVRRLRRALGPGLVRTEPRGYVIDLEPDQLDLDRFRRLVARAAQAADQAERASLLRAALALWHGEPLADLGPDSVLLEEVPRLLEERLHAEEELIEARLRLGEHDRVVPELTELTRRHPRRERLWGQLILALYRCERQGEALAAYREVASRLGEELGVDPGAPLKRLHQAVLTGDPSLAAPGPARPAHAGWRAQCRLPLAVPDLVGRDALLSSLRDLLLATAGVPVVTVSGAPGTGKTALAVRAAHRLREDFPDGQWFTRLSGTGGAPRGAADLLAELLRTAGVEGPAVPDDPQERSALLRAALADRRVLVVLDDAHDAEQVLPLLPGTAGSAVLVTGRPSLSALSVLVGARGIRLGMLAAGDAVELLACVLGRAAVDAEPAAAAELAGLCGGLPLALRIAAANLAARPDRRIADQVASLRSGARLAALGVPGCAVESAFSLSYRALSRDARRLFRLLGLVPGTDFDASAATALLGAPAADLLDELVTANLLERDGGRHRFHDLIRLYAADLARADPAREPALERLRALALSTVDSAAGLLYPQMLRLPVPPASPVVFADARAASDCLDAEHANLVALALDPSAGAAAWLLADGLRGYFSMRMHTGDWLAVATAAVEVARSAGDVRAEAAAEFSLASLHVRRTDAAPAERHAERAIELARRAGWAEGEAAVLHTLGNLHRQSGNPRLAAAYYLRSLDIDVRAGRRAGRAARIHNVGSVLWHLGDLRRATGHYLTALTLDVEDGNRSGQAYALCALGCTLADLGEPADALDRASRALALHRELGDRGGEADALDTLAAVHLLLGHRADAHRLAESAVRGAREARDERIEADASNTLGAACLALGRPESTIAAHDRALELTRHTGDRYAATKALLGRSAASRSAADARQALALARDAGYRVLLGQALSALAELALDRGRPDAADPAAEAVAVLRPTGHAAATARAELLLATAARLADPDPD